MTVITKNYTISGDNSLFFLSSQGIPVTVTPDNPRYKEIVGRLSDTVSSLDDIQKLVDIKNQANERFKASRLSLQGGQVFFGDREVDSSLSHRVRSLLQDNIDVSMLEKFLSNLEENPSYRSVEELYGFLTAARLPITDDGCFLAFKSVTWDFKDFRTETFDNSPGSIPSMPRNQVDDNKDRTCSAGLHFASYDYARGFMQGGRLVVVKINPKDVVSIPTDYNNEKGRACQYEVLREVTIRDGGIVGKDFFGTQIEGTPGTQIITDHSGTTNTAYNPVWDNYEDRSIWKNIPGRYPEFTGTKENFPINRGSTYNLLNKSKTGLFFKYHFTSYSHGNLVFKKYTGLLDRHGVDKKGFEYVTVKDLSSWAIYVSETVKAD